MILVMGRKPANIAHDETPFQKWFEKALDRRGISLAELARRADSDYTHLWKILRGDPVKYPTSRRPGYELTYAIGSELKDLDGALEAAGYPPLLKESPAIYPDPLAQIGPDVDTAALGLVPFFPAGASASFERIRDGHVPPENAAEVLPGNVRAIRVHGGCMAPFFEDGDILFVNETDRAADGDKVIALVDMGAVSCKVYRAATEDDLAYLEPRNGEGRVYVPRFRVHGVVVGYYRGIKRE